MNAERGVRGCDVGHAVRAPHHKNRPLPRWRSRVLTENILLEKPMGEGKQGRGQGWRLNPICPNSCLKFSPKDLTLKNNFTILVGIIEYMNRYSII